ncbi:tetratricopeptide repeat protein [Nitrospirota bacterium]
MVRVILHTALMALVALTLIACTPAKKPEKKPARKKAPSTTMLLLDKGLYEEVAKRMSSRRWQKFSSKRDRVYLYSSAINGFIGKGDSRMKKNEYGEAGVSYRKALDYYPAETSIAKKVKLSKQALLKNIVKCSNALMEAGLLKYRAGQLEEAITIWDRIILFDPNNIEARKALNTATIQLENLRKLK